MTASDRDDGWGEPLDPAGSLGAIGSDPADGSNTARLIDWLLAPVAATPFLQKTWEREALHVARDDPDYYGSLFTLADLDRLLAETALPATNLNLARDGTPLDQGAYALGAFVDMARVLSLHNEGATIILRSIEQWHRGLDQLTRAAVREFGSLAQVNVYATPPANQSTPPHWDTHDLLILQVHGEKIWRLYHADHALPLARERFRDDVHRVGPVREEILVRPGDLLYLPRGTIHEPRADSYSIHVSLGIVPTRIADVLEEVVRLAAGHSEALRRALPPAAAGVPDLVVESAILAALRSLSNRDLIAAVLENRRQSVASHRPEVSGWLTAIAAPSDLDEETIVRRRDGVLAKRRPDAPEELCWADASLTVPTAETAAFLERYDRFRIAQLPGAGDAAARAALAGALIRAGLLQVDRRARDGETGDV